MDKILELDRIVYTFGYVEDKIMLINELVDGVSTWIPIGKGWEYDLWNKIGRRAGLAEAGEILLFEDNKEKRIKIEEYIKIYRTEINDNQIPVEDVFKKFKIKAVAWKSKSLDDNDERYISRQFIDDYKLKELKEDDFKVYYEEEVTSVDVLYRTPANYLRNNMWEVRLIFEQI